MSTCICIGIDLNDHLPNYLDIRLGNMCLIQNIDYEALHYRCHVCHAYGHLRRNFIKIPSNTLYSTIKLSTTKGNTKGKSLGHIEGYNINGFIHMKSQNDV